VIDGVPLFSSIQIYEVQPFCAGLLPSLSHLNGIIAEYCLVVVVALSEPNAFATANIDRRVNLHEINLLL